MKTVIIFSCIVSAISLGIAICAYITSRKWARNLTESMKMQTEVNTNLISVSKRNSEGLGQLAEVCSALTDVVKEMKS